MKKDTTGRLKVRMYNLSRQSHSGVVDETIDGVLGHPMWETRCEGCVLFNSEKPCPIRTNRTSPERGTQRAGRSCVPQPRAGCDCNFAQANDQHVPLRQILTLVVNIVLGDAEDTDNPLLTCETARRAG